MKRLAIACLLLGGCIQGIGQPDHDKVETESQIQPATFGKLRLLHLLDEGEQLLCYYHRSVGDHIFVLTDQKIAEHSGSTTKSIRFADVVGLTHAQTPLGRVTTVRSRDGNEIVYAIYDMNGGSVWKATIDRLWAQEQVKRAVAK